jgi:hypothetical protein
MDRQTDYGEQMTMPSVPKELDLISARLYIARRLRQDNLFSTIDIEHAI